MRRPKADREDEDLQDTFYGKLAAHGIADVFHFVNAQCGFLSVLPPLQPRYAKRIADDDSLTAAIIARAIGHGNLRMAETCDIPYHVLEATDRQHIRLATLKDACDRISNFIADLPIFPLYSFDPDILYGSVDGQKFAIAYNSILLSALLERYRAAGDRKAIMLLRKISPVAWQHIHFLGRYLFRGNRQPIDLLALLADVAL